MYFLTAATIATVFAVIGLIGGDQRMFLAGMHGAIVVLVGLGVLRGIEEHGKGT